MGTSHQGTVCISWTRRLVHRMLVVVSVPPSSRSPCTAFQRAGKSIDPKSQCRNWTSAWLAGWLAGWQAWMVLLVMCDVSRRMGNPPGRELHPKRHECSRPDATTGACLAGFGPDRRNLECALPVVLCSTFRVDGRHWAMNGS